MFNTEISDREFFNIKKLLYDIAGIYLSDKKKGLVMERLRKRLIYYELQDFSSYISIISNPANKKELQCAVDLLTTNETYFFREPKHFSFLQELIEKRTNTGKPFRVWSAACSSGQEPYSIAMLIADMQKSLRWSVVASDINLQVLQVASESQFPIEMAEKIPSPYLKKYCLKGVEGSNGMFKFMPVIRKNIDFCHINLNNKLPDIGLFDVVFLRNVMIYFDVKKKQEILSKVAKTIHSGGYIFIGHSESLHQISDEFKMAAPAIYRKVS